MGTSIGITAVATAFHHFQVTVTDLERSRAFYGGFLGLPELPRPEFAFPGAWFQLAGGQELHIVCVPAPNWRAPRVMEIYETHIALRVGSFRTALEKLHAAGFHEDLPDDHPLKIVIKPHPPTGYPQVYFFDPDRHLLEWNAATLDESG
ncbi:MAG: Glyoxalase/bleomycin resistance protein/dioxygenase [Candidatus Solibacter sp.]|jgi:glyoxylase I family protein|nr:Glyoxalase/bleomycin resistance protein/dioxygenase [Candidatus Solibacter sp.]